MRAVVFDFDGTLADTMGGLSRLAIDMVVGRFGLTEERACDWYRSTVGRSFREQLDYVSTDREVKNSLSAEYGCRKLAVFAGSHLFPDVIDAVKMLRNRRIFVGVASATESGIVSAFLCRSGVVVDWVGGKHQLHDFVLLFSLGACEVLFVGDTAEDSAVSFRAGFVFRAIDRARGDSLFDVLS